MDDTVQTGLSLDKEHVLPSDLRQIMVVPADYIPQVWATALPLLKKCEDYWGAYMSQDGLYEMLVDEVAQLWVMNSAEEFIMAAITEIRSYENRKELVFLALGGTEFSSAYDYLEYIELWAKRQGVSHSRVIGRKAWTKVLKPNGYTEDHVQLVKDISHLREH